METDKNVTGQRGLTKVGPVLGTVGLTCSVTFSAMHLVLRHAAVLWLFGTLLAVREPWCSKGCLGMCSAVFVC